MRFQKGNKTRTQFTSESSQRINAAHPQPQAHYKRIGSMGGKLNRGRRYNQSSGFVLINGRWRNPNKVDL